MRIIKVDLQTFFDFAPLKAHKSELKAYLPDIPQDPQSKRLRPAVLIFPGGGYGHVSEREAEPVALRFLNRGYAAFVLAYAVAPARYPVALQQAALAMRYIRQQAQAFGIDPHMVTAVGFSAGAHLCGCLATMYDGEAVAQIGAPAQLRPDAVGLCYPVAVSWGRTHDGSFDNLCGDDEELRQRLSLEKCVHGDMPPVFLWHTRQDTAVPCRNSLLLAAALEEQGVPFAMHIYHKGVHGLSVADETVYPPGEMPQISADVPSWPEAMLAFFREMGIYLV